VRPGTIAGFDIGFIGVGNPEIVRDKLSRFARSVETGRRQTSSTTFIVVDRIPSGPNASSRRLADRSGTALVQMSMSLWPRELARELAQRVQYRHPLASYGDAEVEAYIDKAMARMDVLAFLRRAAEDHEEANQGDA
jgi:hypothetical protein